ncbi:MAG: hypothetical protein QOJ75_1691 [Chloroflexota bacterium]|jgi:hypothetical protein|nr:hypothetical protein [Chloroflexota bacterium]
MAEHTQRGTRGHERSSRRDSRPAAVAAGTANAPGFGLTSESTIAGSETHSVPEMAPAATPLATFRLLQNKGLTPGEAASLTAFMCGLPTSDLRWSLRQINQMLFLQRLYKLGRFDLRDGERTRPH